MESLKLGCGGRDGKGGEGVTWPGCLAPGGEKQYNDTTIYTETVEQLHAIPQHGSQPNGSSSIRSLSTRFQLLLSSFHWQEQGSSSGVVVEKCQHSFNHCSSHYCCVNVISAPSMDSSSRSSGWLKNIISDTAPATDFNQYCCYYNHRPD